MAGHFRAYPRRTSSTPPSAKIAGSDATVRVVDLGLGGAGIVTTLVLDLGARIDLVLALPNRWDPLVLPARVAWAREGRAGVAFEHRSDADAWALFELLGTQSFEG